MHEPISLLLVDDQKLLREGIRILLDREDDLTIVGEAGDGEEAVDLYVELRPDVVLMDVQMPNVDGVAAIQRIHGSDPQAKVIILTTFDNDEYVYEGMRAGAMGYLLKTMSSDELASAVRTVHLGGALLEPTVARKVFSAIDSSQPLGRSIPRARPGGRERAGTLAGELPAGREKAKSGPVEGPGGREEANARLPEPLSRREREVLGLIAEGMSNRNIANRLNLAEGTIKNYVSSLIGKLNARDRTQAAMMSKELGLIP